jgi:hypothetical protein
MFAKIKVNKRMYDTVRYNEQKQKQGQAECLSAVNFIKDADDLTMKEKMYHFNRLTSLNENVHSQALHISLNFHPADKLSKNEMVQIAKTYMEKMDLGRQPYLVYRHDDSGHPHLHLATTVVQKDGSRLTLKPKHYYESQRLTQEMDEKYQLTQFRERMQQKENPRQALKIEYGSRATMPALSNVLDKVLPSYKYTTMEELNAVLRLYNVEAYRGKEDSHLYQHRGVIYRVLDDEGKARGTSIKASLFNSKPTLDKLEKKFELNLAEAQRQQHRQRVTANLEWNMAKKNMDLPTLQKTLEKERITMVWTEAKDGKKQNVFYVDHETKAVFDGSKLGERYDAAALRQRLVPTQVQEEKQVLHHQQRHHHTIMHDL